MEFDELQTRNCFVCYKDINGYDSIVSLGNEMGGTGIGESNDLKNKVTEKEECSLLKSQLPVIFLLRKFLELPNNMCSQFLQEYGHPSSWIQWCDSCSTLVKRAKTCFDEITALQKTFGDLRVEIKNTILLTEKTRLSENLEFKKFEIQHGNGLADIIRNYIISNGELRYAAVSNPKIKEEMEQTDYDYEDNNCMEFSPIVATENESEEYTSPSEKLNCRVKNFRNYYLSKGPRKKLVSHRKKNYQSILKNSARNRKRKSRTLNDTGSTSENDDNEEINSPTGFVFPSECEIKIDESTEVGDQEEKLKCPQCPKEFKTKSYLRKHLKYHSENRPHKCEVCSKCYVTMQDLKEHSLTHTKERPFACNSCGKTFRQACSLGRHQRDQACGTLHECTVCHEKFDQIRKLKQHCLGEHGSPITEENKSNVQSKRKSKSPCQCSICGKVLSREQDLKRHLITHTGERPHSCPTCGKTFKQSGEVTVHMRIHTGERPFRCQVCEKRFKTNSELRVHSKTHTGSETRLLCTVCGKAMANSRNLRNHMMSHTGEKPFSCTVCGHKSTTADRFRRHALTHTGERPCLCTVCGKGFPTPFQLKSHERRIHLGEKPFSCDVCGKAFPDRNDLKKHARVHSKETIQLQ